METVLALLSRPFTWGLMLGLLIASFSFWNHMKTKRELRRYQRHLSDKLELEAKQLEGLKHEREKLMKENENLRLRVGMQNEKPDQRQARNLEILARAEKRMMINAPGFAAAWETAKSDAASDLEAEDRGSSLPKRLFSRLLGTASEHSEESVDSTTKADRAANTEARAFKEASVKAS